MRINSALFDNEYVQSPVTPSVVEPAAAFSLGSSWRVVGREQRLACGNPAHALNTVRAPLLSLLLTSPSRSPSVRVPVSQSCAYLNKSLSVR